MHKVLEVVRRVRGPRASATRSSSSARARSASSPPSSAPRTACRVRTCARAASTGTCAATASPYLAYNELDWKVWTHPDGDSFARYWVRLQETRESARMVLQLLDQMPRGPDHGEGAAHHQGARGRSLGQHREPARRDGLLRHLEGRDRSVPRQDPLRVVQQRVDPAVDAARRVRPRHRSRSSPASTSSWETSTGDRSPRVRHRLGDDARDQDADRARPRAVDRAHPRLHLLAEDDEPHAEPARADGPRRVPRLVPTHRRRHQVHAKGRHHAGATPTGASSRWRRPSS